MQKTKLDDFALFGGSKVFDTFRTTMNLVQPLEKTFYNYAQISFTENHLTGDGPVVKILEEKLAKFHDVEYCVSFCNCFVGMFLAINHIALAEKTEIVTPSLAYRRTCDIIDWAGYKPRFCDIDPHTLGISAKTVEPLLNQNTALILAPHPITNLCDIEGLEALSSHYNIPLFFDSVEACGGSHKEKMIGGFGVCESFSMHPSKVLNGAEGGYITTNSKELNDTLRLIRNSGKDQRGRINILGYNAHLNELHAALALSTLEDFENQLNNNKRSHLCYQKVMADIPGITVLPYHTEDKRNWKSCLVKLDSNWPFTRAQTLQLLNAEEINARSYYSPAQHTSYEDASGSPPDIPFTLDAEPDYMILPFGSTVSDSDIKLIAQFIHDSLSHSESILKNLTIDYEKEHN